MKLFNTKTQKLEQLKPLDDQIVLYVADRGPEEELRISHLFLYSVVDVLVRYLEMKGLRVKVGHLIDDNLNEEEPPIGKLVERFSRAMRSLNVRPPDYLSPLVTEPGTADLDRRNGNIDVLVGAAVSLAAASDQGEPAQVASTSNRLPPARFRLQTAIVNRAGSKTSNMSVDEIAAEALLERYSGDAMRIYLAQHHYRSSWTPDRVLLEKAAKHAEKLKAALKALSTGDRLINIVPLKKRFEAALDNDLDTVKAIATLLNLADEILFRAPNDYLVDHAQVALRQMATVFGLRLDRELPEGRVVTGWREYQERIGLDLESTSVR